MSMRTLRLRLAGFGYQDWLLFCFAVGVCTGTGAALAFGGRVVQGCILGTIGGAGSARGGAESFFLVFKQRAMEVCTGWLAGLTVCSQLLFGFLTLYAGMCLGAALSILTMQKGLLGIAAFLGRMLPQGLIYLGVWYVLSRWAGQREKKLHLMAGILLLAMTALGVFAEISFIPWLGSLLLNGR